MKFFCIVACGLISVFNALAQSTTWIVAPVGKADFKSIQQAFDAVPVNNKKPITIFIKNGVYTEKLLLDSSKDFVTLAGEDKFKTVLTYDDHSGKVVAAGDTINTYTSATLFVKANNFKAENLTVENSAGFTAGQAVGLRIEGDQATIINCRITGNQDILFLSNPTSRQYFEQCYIEGTTDFIFGPSTAWFQQCHIHSKKNSHITAASTPQQNKYGFVFNDCILTGDSALQNVSLGRPWRPFAHVVYMHCFLGQHIKPDGWANWNKTDNYLTTRYFEYMNYGPGASPQTRVSWAKQLREPEAAALTPKSIFNGWIPATP